MLRTTRRQTATAQARSSAPHSSGRDRASARPKSARSTGSAPAPAPAPARNVRLLRSLYRTSRRPRRGLIRLRCALRRTWLFGDSRCLGAVAVFPVPLLLQGVGDILRHIGLVVLAKHDETYM